MPTKDYPLPLRERVRVRGRRGAGMKNIDLKNMSADRLIGLNIATHSLTHSLVTPYLSCLYLSVDREQAGKNLLVKQSKPFFPDLVRGDGFFVFGGGE